VRQYTSIGQGGLFRIRRDGSHFEFLHFFTDGQRSPVRNIAIIGSSIYGAALDVPSSGQYQPFIFRYRMDRTGPNAYSVVHRFPLDAPLPTGVAEAFGQLYVVNEDSLDRLESDGTLLRVLDKSVVSVRRQGDFLYGTTRDSLPELFRMGPQGENYETLRVLDNVTGTPSNVRLWAGSDGAVYGVTQGGGRLGGGTLYRVDPEGTAAP
jgi:uncharacterized repeat protein (TIGR03803 family)